jgi:hypothetical protein
MDKNKTTGVNRVKKEDEREEKERDTLDQFGRDHHETVDATIAIGGQCH